MTYIITGVSRGLGEAIAKLYLSEGNEVIGIGRRHSIEHDEFTFIEQDLSDLESLKKIILPNLDGPVTLTVALFWHPLKSVTVTVYNPTLNPVACAEF